MKRVVVMGLGRFGGGVGVARWFAKRGDDVLVTDPKSEADLAASVEELRACDVKFRLGGHDPADFENAEIVVVNPAVPFDHPLVARAEAAGARITTEMGLTLRHLPGVLIAITGTNGKSTTAGLTAAMLEAARVPCALGGNIGRSLLNECASMSARTVAVLEISSFQLSWLERDALVGDALRPHAAVITNVTGDHFDRHGSFEHDVASKRRLAESVGRDGLLILPRGDGVAAEFANATAGSVAWFGGSEPDPVDLAALAVVGPHNRANAAAAALAAMAAHATKEACAVGAACFRGLPHRLELLGERHGVLRVNDSVSTTPQATAAAVRSFDRPVILLVGGRDKGLDWGPLLDAAREAHTVIAYGETGPRIQELVPGARLVPDLASAVAGAQEAAHSGDVILLSPGFASYDEFPGFDRRGALFRELVG